MQTSAWESDINPASEPRVQPGDQHPGREGPRIPLCSSLCWWGDSHHPGIRRPARCRAPRHQRCPRHHRPHLSGSLSPYVRSGWVWMISGAPSALHTSWEHPFLPPAPPRPCPCTRVRVRPACPRLQPPRLSGPVTCRLSAESSLPAFPRMAASPLSSPGVPTWKINDSLELRGRRGDTLTDRQPDWNHSREQPGGLLRLLSPQHGRGGSVRPLEGRPP